jgi:hypothetical protein
MVGLMVKIDKWFLDNGYLRCLRRSPKNKGSPIIISLLQETIAAQNNACGMQSNGR